MTCTSRYLTADGRVLRCFGDVIQPTNGEPFCEASYGDSFGNDPWDHAAMSRDALVGWREDDPLAWDASVCPDCGGRGWANRDPVRKHGKNTPCPRCDGVGTVDDPPARLIGPGSVVNYNGDRPLLVQATDADGLFLLRDHEWLGWHVRWDERDTTWTLVRAVPPASWLPDPSGTSYS